MNLIQAVLLGIVEGVTEFLPISSTAHLILTSKFLGLAQTEFQKFFEVFIQMGAVLAVVFLYIKYLLKHRELIKNVLISFVPTAMVGLLLYKIIKTVFFNSNLLIAISLVAIGFVFILLEQRIKNRSLVLSRNLSQMSWREALIVGLFQSLAVVPGVSRAGIVMVALMGMKFKRTEAALYSFLLAVPTIAAASLLDLYKSKDLLLSSQSNVALLVVGFMVSFVTAFVSLRWLIAYLQNNSLVNFAYYRFALAIIVVLIFGL